MAYIIIVIVIGIIIISIIHHLKKLHFYFALAKEKPGYAFALCTHVVLSSLASMS